MKCPKCQHSAHHKVTETREHEGLNYRRRACGNCGQTFITREEAPEGLKMPKVVQNSINRGHPRKSRAIHGPAPVLRGDGGHLQDVWR